MERWSKAVFLVITLAFHSANWECVMKALLDMEVTKYLRNRCPGHKITGGASQGSVLGPLVCNIMYDCLLKVIPPREAKLVAYAESVAIVTVAK